MQADVRRAQGEDGGLVDRDFLLDLALGVLDDDVADCGDFAEVLVLLDCHP